VQFAQLIAQWRKKPAKAGTGLWSPNTKPDQRATVWIADPRFPRPTDDWCRPGPADYEMIPNLSIPVDETLRMAIPRRFENTTFQKARMFTSGRRATRVQP